MNDNVSPDYNSSESVPTEHIPKGWTTPPTVAELKGDYLGAKPYRDAALTKIGGYRDNLHVTGSAKPKARKGFSTVQPKLIRKHAEWRYAALSEAFLATSDMFKLKGRTHADKESAKQNELLLNYQWNNLVDKVPFVDKFVRKGVDEGTPFIRVGWESQEEDYIESVPIYEFFPATEQSQVEELQQAAQLNQKDPYAFKQHIPEHIQQALQLTEAQGQPIYPVLTGSEEVEKTRMLVNQPTYEVCVTDNLTVDPSCKGDLDKAEFAIYSFDTSKGELNKDSRYFNVSSIQPAQESILSQPDHTIKNNSDFNLKDDTRAKFVAYEYWGYWDVNGSGITTAIVATWVGSTLIRLEKNPYPDQKIPFVSTQYLPVDDEVYGEPDGALLKDNQDIIGAVTRGAIDTMARSAVGQKGIRQDALDTTNKRKFSAGEDFEFNPMVDPRQAIIDFNYPEIPNSVSLMLNIQQTEADNMTGVRSFGATDSSAGTTATADRGVLDAATKRETGILRRYARAMQIIAKKTIAMNAEFLSDEEIIRVTDEEFVAIRREDLKGNFDIEVTITTAEEDNAKAKELAFMLQTMGNTLPLEMSQIVLADIAYLRKMPNLAKRIEDYQPQPDPMAEKMQQLEMAKMELELAELQAKTQKLQTAAQLDMAKVQEAGVKAGNVQSDTDQKNLDFLDQESGRKHAQNMEQDGAQARSNIALEIVKADLNPPKSQ